jgi:hypothetical protein
MEPDWMAQKRTLLPPLASTSLHKNLFSLRIIVSVMWSPRLAIAKTLVSVTELLCKSAIPTVGSPVIDVDI